MMERSQYAGPTQVTVWAYVLLVWFSLVLGGSLLGAFVSSHAQPPLALGMAVVVPIALFLLGYFWSAGFRQFVSSMSAQTITRIQIYRVLGVVFLILYSRGLLPGVFALPAGWGDVFVGVTAPLVALVQSSTVRFRRGIFAAWNIFGMLDLVVAVSLGILVSRSSLGLLAGTSSSAAMALFPLSLVPTFLVPLSFILHLVGLSHVRKQ